MEDFRFEYGGFGSGDHWVSRVIRGSKDGRDGWWLIENELSAGIGVVIRIIMSCVRGILRSGGCLWLR